MSALLTHIASAGMHGTVMRLFGSGHQQEVPLKHGTMLNRVPVLLLLWRQVPGEGRHADKHSCLLFMVV